MYCSFTGVHATQRPKRIRRAGDVIFKLSISFIHAFANAISAEIRDEFCLDRVGAFGIDL